MEQEIIFYPFDSAFDTEEKERSERFDETPDGIYIERSQNTETEVNYVNGHNLPDDEDEDEDDLILGDEDELDEEDLDEAGIDVELDDEVDAEVSEDDLVLDADTDLDDDDL